MKRYIAIALISPGFWAIVQMPGQRILEPHTPWNRLGQTSWPNNVEGRANAEAAAKFEAKKRHIAYAGEEK